MRAEDIIGLGQLRAWHRHPRMSAIIFGLRPVAHDDWPGPLAVDDGMRLHHNPAAVRKVGVKGIGVMVAHESFHPLLDHVGRARRMGAAGWGARYERVRRGADALVRGFGSSWGALCNLGADFEINYILERAGWKGDEWPEDFKAVRAEAFNMPEGLAMEVYVRSVVERAEQAQEEEESGGGGVQQDVGAAGGEGHAGGGGDGGDGDDEDGPEPDDQEAEADPGGEGGAVDEAADGDGEPGGDGGPGGAGGGGQVEADHEPHGGAGSGRCGGCCCTPHDFEEVTGDGTPPKATPSEIEVVRIRVARAVVEAHERGELPAGFELDWATAMLRPPKVPWERVFAARVRAAVARARGSTDLVYGPPSQKREMMKQWLGEDAPLMSVPRGPEPRACFVLDVSGSMTGGPLATALDEAPGIVRAAGGRATGIAVDADVQAEVEVRTGDDLRKLMRGGGGTDMRVGIRLAMELRPRPDIVIVLTDGQTPWPEARDTPPNLVAAVIGDEEVPEHLERHVVRIPLDEED